MPGDQSEAVISDSLLYGQASNSKPSRWLSGKGAEVSLEPAAEVAFSSKQSAHNRGTSWGDLFWTPPHLSQMLTT